MRATFAALVFAISLPAAAANFSLHGTVYGGSNALAGADVSAVVPGTTTVVDHSVSSAAGAYALSLPGGTYNLTVTPPATSAYTPQTIRSVSVTADNNYDIVLVSSASSSTTVSGIITGDGGAALANTYVSVYGNGLGSSTRTDATGHFSIAVSAGTGSFSVNYSNGYPVSAAEPQQWQCSRSVTLNGAVVSADLALPVAAVHGLVKGSDSKALPNVSVSGYSYGSDPASGVYCNSWFYAQTAADGTYSLRALVGNANFNVQAPSGYGPANKNVGITGAQAVDFVLPSLNNPLQGTVYGKANTPLANTYVSVNSQSGYIGSVRTDANGHWKILVGEGSYSVYYSNGYPVSGDEPQQWQCNQYSVPVTAGGATSDLHLPMISVTGTVKSESGRGVPSAYLNGYGGASFNSTYCNNWFYAQSGATGTYAVSLFSGYQSWNVQPSGTGFGPASQSTSFTADSTLDFTLPTYDKPLSGTVYGRDGAPLANASVYVQDQRGGGRSARTDAYGSWQVLVGAGTYQLYWSNGYPVSPSEPRQWQCSRGGVVVTTSGTADLRLPVATLVQKFTDSNGAPVPNVSMSSYSGAPEPGGGYCNNWIYGNSDAAGLSIQPVFKGTYTFQIYPPAGSGFLPLSLNNVGVSQDLTQDFILQLPDHTAPTIVSGPYVVHLSNDAVSIAWVTDKAADSVVHYGTDAQLLSTASLADFTTRHSVTLTGLTANTAYQYRVGSTDEHHNGPTWAPAAAPWKTFSSIAPPGDVTPPAFTVPPKVLFVDTSTAIVQWTTDEPTTAKVVYGTSPTALTLSVETPVNTFSQQHSMALSGLTPNTVYYAQAQSIDPDGNGPVKSSPLAFSTLAVPDRTWPLITAGPTAISVTDSRIVVGWTTDKPSDSGVSFNDGQRYFTLYDGTLVTSHSITMSGLTPQGTYRITVSSTDASGNGPTLGTQLNVTTNAGRDLVPPRFTVAPAASGQTLATMTLTWTTDKASTTQVQFGTATGVYTTVASDLAFVTQHQIVLTGLSIGATYYAVAESVDASGNDALSSEISFTTQNYAPTATCIGSAAAPASIAPGAGGSQATIDSTNAGSCNFGTCTFDGQPYEILPAGLHSVAVVSTAADLRTASCTSFISITPPPPSVGGGLTPGSTTTIFGSAATGTSVTLTGTTVPGATISVTVTGPDGVAHVTTVVAGADGKYTITVDVGVGKSSVSLTTSTGGATSGSTSATVQVLPAITVLSLFGGSGSTPVLSVAGGGTDLTFTQPVDGTLLTLPFTADKQPSLLDLDSPGGPSSGSNGGLGYVSADGTVLYDSTVAPGEILYVYDNGQQIDTMTADSTGHVHHRTRFGFGHHSVSYRVSLNGQSSSISPATTLDVIPMVPSSGWDRPLISFDGGISFPNVSFAPFSQVEIWKVVGGVAVFVALVAIDSTGLLPAVLLAYGVYDLVFRVHIAGELSFQYHVHVSTSPQVNDCIAAVQAGSPAQILGVCGAGSGAIAISSGRVCFAAGNCVSIPGSGSSGSGSAPSGGGSGSGTGFGGSGRGGDGGGAGGSLAPGGTGTIIGVNGPMPRPDGTTVGDASTVFGWLPIDFWGPPAIPAVAARAATATTPAVPAQAAIAAGTLTIAVTAADSSVLTYTLQAGNDGHFTGKIPVPAGTARVVLTVASNGVSSPPSAAITVTVIAPLDATAVTGGSLEGAQSAGASVSLTLRGAPGAQVTAFVNGAASATFTFDAAGSFRGPIVVPFGSSVLSFVERTSDGAVSTPTTGVPFTVVPAPIALDAPIPANVLGTTATGGSFTLSGTGVANASVLVTVNGTVISIAIGADGHFKASITLPYGAFTLSYVESIALADGTTVSTLSKSASVAIFPPAPTLSAATTGASPIGTLGAGATLPVVASGIAGATLVLYDGDLQVATFTLDLTGHISSSWTLPYGHHTLTFAERAGGVASALTAPIDLVVVPAAPVVLAPQNLQENFGLDPAGATFGFAGTGVPGSTVIILVDGVASSVTFTVDLGGSWSGELKLSFGVHQISVSQQNGGAASAPALAFQVVSRPSLPTITSVSQGQAFVGTSIPIAGTGVPNGTLLVYLDGALDPIASFTGGVNGWAGFSVTLTYGSHLLSFAQVLGALTGPHTTPVRIDVVPAAPSFAATLDGSRNAGTTATGGTFTLQGAGVAGATVRLLEGSAVLASATVAAGGAFTLSVTLAYGAHALAISQEIAAETSATSAAITFHAVPFVPSAAAPTAQQRIAGSTATGGAVTFSVAGVTGGVLTVTEGAAQTLTAGAGALYSGPLTFTYGPHAVVLTQSVNGETSDAASAISFDVFPQAPQVAAVSSVVGATFTGGSIAITASGVPGAVLSILDPAGPTQTATLDASGSLSAQFSFTYGRHDLSFTQAIAGETSPATSPQRLDVIPAAPVLGAPVNAQVDLAAGLLGEDLAVNGTGVPGAIVSVSADGTLSPQQGTVDAQGRFTFAVTLAYGRHALSFSQSIASETSASSVTLLVDIRPVPPVVSAPLATTSTTIPFTGTGVAVAIVTVLDSGAPVQQFTTDAGGRFSGTAVLYYGPHFLSYTQAIANETSAATQPVRLDVVPPPPTLAAAPTLIADRPLVTSGTTVPNSTVTVLEGNTALATATSDAAGNWTASFTLPCGAHTLSAIDSLNGETSAASIAVTTLVYPPAPVFATTPKALDNKAAFTGTSFAAGTPTTITVYDAGVKVTSFAATGSAWSFDGLAAPRLLADLGHSLTFTATINAFESAPAAFAFVLWTQAPRLVISPAAGTVQDTASQPFSYSYAAGFNPPAGVTMATVTWTFDGSALAGTAVDLTMVLPGTHTLTVSAVDNLGNADATPFVSTFSYAPSLATDRALTIQLLAPLAGGCPVIVDEEDQHGQHQNNDGHSNKDDDDERRFTCENLRNLVGKLDHVKRAIARLAKPKLEKDDARELRENIREELWSYIKTVDRLVTKKKTVPAALGNVLIADVRFLLDQYGGPPREDEHGQHGEAERHASRD